MKPDAALHLAALVVVLIGALALALSGQSIVFLAITAVVAWFGYQRLKSGQPPLLDSFLASLICLTAVAATLARMVLYEGMPFATSAVGRLSVGGEFLLMIQWVLLLKRASVREYVLICLMGVVVVACGALLVPEIRFAFLFFLYLVAAMCFMSLALEHHERSRVAGAVAVAPPPRRLTRFVGRRAMTAAALLVPTAIIFVAIPRSAMPISLGQRLLTEGVPVTQVGFTETVAAGDVASIRAGSAKVMEVEVTTPDGERPDWDPSLRMRGMALDSYDGRVWTSTFSFQPAGGNHLAGDTEWYNFAQIERWQGPRLLCRVTREPLDTRILFAPFAPVAAHIHGNIGVLINARQYSLRMALALKRRVVYNTESVLPPGPDAPSLGPPIDMPRITRRIYVDLPIDLSPRIGDLARQIVPPRLRADELAAARRVEAHLLDPRNCTYSPSPGFSGDAEPVEYFLFERKAGHCEHFAAAMVVLLRSLGIPARLVTGFIGGDWNAIGGYYVFRQSHAHAWVEVYSRTHGWVTFDPTPSAGTPGYAPPPRRFAGLRDLGDYVTRLWYTYVIGFDRAMQADLLARLRAAWQAAVGAARQALTDWLHVDALGEKLRAAVDWLGGNVRAGAALVRRAPWLALTGLLVVALLAAWLVHQRQVRHRVATAFYRRLLNLLQRRGFSRAPVDTPLEFARRVTETVGPQAAGVLVVTQYFCRVRYADRPLTTDEERRVEAMIRAMAKERWGR